MEYEVKFMVVVTADDHFDAVLKARKLIQHPKIDPTGVIPIGETDPTSDDNTDTGEPDEDDEDDDE